MKPQELRLGNFIADKIYKTPMWIVSMGLDDKRDAYLYLEFDGNNGDVWENYIDEITPLLINDNDNLLERFGFVYDEPTGKWLALKKTETIYLKRNGNAYDVYTRGYNAMHEVVEYIHELQNVVFDKLGIVL